MKTRIRKVELNSGKILYCPEICKNPVGTILTVISWILFLIAFSIGLYFCKGKELIAVVIGAFIGLLLLLYECKDKYEAVYISWITRLDFHKQKHNLKKPDLFNDDDRETKTYTELEELAKWAIDEEIKILNIEAKDKHDKKIKQTTFIKYP